MIGLGCSMGLAEVPRKVLRPQLGQSIAAELGLAVQARICRRLTGGNWFASAIGGVPTPVPLDYKPHICNA